MALDFSIIYPDWYKTEKDTGKIIKKLSSLKELDYYLTQPDEYIRRLALLRLGEIKVRESIEVLKSILDDKMETPRNKEVAGWALKAVCHKYNYELFISSKYTTPFSGKEDAEDLHRVATFEDPLSLKLNFSTSYVSAQLKNDDPNVRQMFEIEFDTPFDFKEWIQVWFEDFQAVSKNLFLHFPALMVMLMVRLAKWQLHTLSHATTHIKKGLQSQLYKIKLSKKYKGGSYLSKQQNFTLIKPVSTVNVTDIFTNFIFYIFYILLFPIRILIGYKRFLIPITLLLYVALTFIPTGRLLVSKYASPDIRVFQERVFESTTSSLVYSWSFIKEQLNIDGSSSIDRILSALNTTVPENTQSELTPQTQNTWFVISKSGLNIRTKPDENSPKAIKESIPYSTAVLYLSKNQNDAIGREWYLIELPDGTTGWVISKGLSEKKEE